MLGFEVANLFGGQGESSLVQAKNRSRTSACTFTIADCRFTIGAEGTAEPWPHIGRDGPLIFEMSGESGSIRLDQTKDK